MSNIIQQWKSFVLCVNFSPSSSSGSLWYIAYRAMYLHLFICESLWLTPWCCPLLSYLRLNTCNPSMSLLPIYSYNLYIQIMHIANSYLWFFGGRNDGRLQLGWELVVVVMTFYVLWGVNMGYSLFALLHHLPLLGGILRTMLPLNGNRWHSSSGRNSQAQ